MNALANKIRTEDNSRVASLPLLAPTPEWTEIGASEHFVQFYESDSFLIDSVAKFIGSGLGSGEAGLVIGTRDHLQALEEQLTACGFDLGMLKSRGQYVPLDAAETLATFMVDGVPDPELFTRLIGKTVSRAAKGGRPVRAFGEMVALLWADGNGAAAVRLEELWNELGKEHAFSLFCAYPIDGFRGEANVQPFLHICEAHSRVIPAESYAAQTNANERLRSITLLQQKARSLEGEIVDRKHAESSAREQQTKLTMAVTVARLGIWELDLQTHSLTCSDQCKTHLGASSEETLTYSRLVELIHPDDREAVHGALQNAIAANAEFTTEFRIPDPLGQFRWIVCRGRCFHNGAHRMIGVTLDITERTQAAQILEQTVTERTSRLQETIAELEAFSYSISHDMRAPLRSMRGFADILLEECGDKVGHECRTYLERIATSAGRMERLIQDVLTLSRVGRDEFNLEPVALDSLVRVILDSYPNLQPPNAEIVVEGTLPPVLGNEAALTQCLSNLLGNAVKFVPPGRKPLIRVRAELFGPYRSGAEPAPVNHQLSWVRLSVQDNGIGISRDSREKIFAIFERLSKKYEGTGIGLAIVKKAAERMGGREGLDTEPGHGITFWLEIRHAGSAMHGI